MHKFRPTLNIRPKTPIGIPNIRPPLPQGFAPRPSPLSNPAHLSIPPTTGSLNLDSQVSANISVTEPKPSSSVQDSNPEHNSVHSKDSQSISTTNELSCCLRASPSSLFNQSDTTNSDLHPTTDCLAPIAGEDTRMQKWLKSQPETSPQITSGLHSPQFQNTSSGASFSSTTSPFNSPTKSSQIHDPLISPVLPPLAVFKLLVCLQQVDASFTYPYVYNIIEHEYLCTIDERVWFSHSKCFCSVQAAPQEQAYATGGRD